MVLRESSSMIHAHESGLCAWWVVGWPLTLFRMRSHPFTFLQVNHNLRCPPLKINCLSKINQKILKIKNQLYFFLSGMTMMSLVVRQWEHSMQRAIIRSTDFNIRRKNKRKQSGGYGDEGLCIILNGFISLTKFFMINNVYNYWND